MRKFLYSMIAVLGAFVFAEAQNNLSFLVSAGYQGANISSSNGAKFDVVSGARAGVAVDMPLWSKGNLVISAQPGLNFSMKGWGSNDIKMKMSTYYIDLPILAGLTYGISNDLNVLGNFGPYLGYGIGGGGTVEGEKVIDNPFSPGEVFGFNLVNIGKRFDWGLQFGAGVEYKRISLIVGSQIGLFDLSNPINLKDATGGMTDGLPIDLMPELGGLLDQTLDATTKNISFHITIGYRL